MHSRCLSHTVRNRSLHQCKHLLHPKFETFLSRIASVTVAFSFCSPAHPPTPSQKLRLYETKITCCRRRWKESNLSRSTESPQFARQSSCEASTTQERGHATVESVCSRWTEQLAKSNVPEAQASVEYFVAHVLGRKTASMNYDVYNS